ncbi:Sodium/hydrogen exchanger family-domain-containing protein [Yarrowia lipolytica]|nr:Sodium/hydrogen exchanger family-domain-containing protein [Yarrowia lipolytica]
MPVLNISNFNIVTACLGGFALVFGLISYVVKEHCYMGEALPALLFGLIFNKAKWVIPEEYGNVREITLEFSRLVLGIQLVLAGVQLPAKYLVKEWRSFFFLLVPVMTTMWVVTALIIWLIFPNLRYLDALIIGSCVTPTDPVLSNSVVKGKFAEKYVSESLRNIISAESGANDGFGYPFLFLALYIDRYSGTKIAKEWIVETILYEILLSVAYGAVIGYLGQELLGYAKKFNFVDDESFLVFVFALGLFILGTAGMIGTDDLLAAFIAGNAFTWNDWFREETKDDTLQPTLDLMLNFAIFLWVGVVMPWGQFNQPHLNLPVWRFVLCGICVLVFRRLPAMLVFYKFIPTIKNIKEALFAGFFGPIGIGAIFYLHTALNKLDEFIEENEHGEAHTYDPHWLITVMYPLVYFLILSSVVVHGITIPVSMLGKQLPTTLSRTMTMTRSFSRSRSASRDRTPRDPEGHVKIDAISNPTDLRQNIHVVDESGTTDDSQDTYTRPAPEIGFVIPDRRGDQV